jgi:hypothetical protein
MEWYFTTILSLLPFSGNLCSKAVFLVSKLVLLAISLDTILPPE